MLSTVYILAMFIFLWDVELAVIFYYWFVALYTVLYYVFIFDNKLFIAYVYFVSLAVPLVLYINASSFMSIDKGRRKRRGREGKVGADRMSYIRHFMEHGKTHA
jgi:hypothetical protein